MMKSRNSLTIVQLNDSHACFDLHQGDVRQSGKTVGLTGGEIVVMPEENLERMFARDPHDYRFLHRSNIDGSTPFLPAGCFYLPLSRSYMTIRLNPTLFKWHFMTVF